MNELHIFGQTTSLVEVIAMLTGIAGVWLTARQNVWCFPIGIINVALYAWLFFSPGVSLYADALLQCIYIMLLFYGWYRWDILKKNAGMFRPTKINSSIVLKLSLITAISSVALGFFFKNFTSASYPWLDSALTCVSLAAQWMIAKKFIENWIVWIVADMIYIPLYINKHLPLTAILYSLFLLLAFKGYRDWNKNMEAHA